jgi:hypothetical protein
MKKQASNPDKYFNISTVNEIDYREITRTDLQSEKLQNLFKDKFDSFILAAIEELNYMKKIWEKAALYYEGFQPKLGFSGDLMQAYANSSGLREMKIDKDNSVPYIDNIIKQAHDAIIGEYTSVKKSVQVSAGGISRFHQIAKKYQNILKYFDSNISGFDEDDNEDIWIDYRVPAIDLMILYGYCSTKMRYNKYRKLKSGGAIEMETVEPMEILIDPLAKNKYFKDANIKARRRAVEINEARDYLTKRYGIDKKKIVADTEVMSFGFLRNKKSSSLGDKHNEYITLYEIEHRRKYFDKTKYSTIHKLKVPEGWEEPEIEQENNVYFECLYNPVLGVIDHNINPLQQYSLTDYFDQTSRLRQYPLSRHEFFWTLQDFNNMGKTLLADNARQQNILRLFITRAIGEEFGPEVMQKFLRIGGALDVPESVGELNKQIHQVQMDTNLRPEVYELFQTAEKNLKEISQRTNPMDGEFPSDKLAFRTVNTLIQQGRRAMSNIDISITRAAIQESKLIYKMAKNYFNDDMMIEVTGDNPNNKARIPLGGKLKLVDYEKLVEANKMTIEQFEEENDVHYLHPKEPSIPDVPPQVIADKSIVVVNPLYEDDVVQIKVTMDFLADMKAADRVQALEYLFSNPEVGLAVFDQMLDALGFELEKDEIKKKVDERNRFKFIEEEIQKRGPQAEQAIMNALQNLDVQQMVEQKQ